MGTYRIYHLRKDGHIANAENMEFDGDSEAIRFAHGLLGDLPGVEVWQQARLVKKLMAESCRAA